MDEFNKPLGVKTSGPEKSPTASNSARWTGIAGLVAGTLALGLVGWQFFGNHDATAPVAEPQTETAANETESDEGSTSTAEVSEEQVAGEAGEEGSSEETGLTEIEPNGTIAVPKPRPPRAKPQEQGLAHLPDPDLTERGATGVIPKRGVDGRRPMDVYAREPDTTGNFGVARVVLIVGGMGISQTASQLAIRELPPTVTLAYAPYGNSLLRWMQAARKKGHEILLQLPMEPFGYPSNSPGPHTLVSTASPQENQANLHWLMSRITNYVGVMSFQGAKLLSEPAGLKPIFDELADRGLIFVDEGTAGNSKSVEVASRSLLAHAVAQVQIDAKRTRRDIASQIELLVKEAKRKGVAIGVSNGFPETINILAEFAKKANKLGVEITPLSAIVEDPERDN